MSWAGVCAKIIDYYSQSIGKNPFSLVTDEKSIAGMLSAIYQRVEGGYATEGDLKGIRTLITYIKNSMLDAAEIKKLEQESGWRIAEIYRLMESVTEFFVCHHGASPPAPASSASQESLNSINFSKMPPMDMDRDAYLEQLNRTLGTEESIFADTMAEIRDKYGREARKLEDAIIKNCSREEAVDIQPQSQRVHNQRPGAYFLVSRNAVRQIHAHGIAVRAQGNGIVLADDGGWSESGRTLGGFLQNAGFSTIFGLSILTIGLAQPDAGSPPRSSLLP